MTLKGVNTNIARNDYERNTTTIDQLPRPHEMMQKLQHSPTRSTNTNKSIKNNPTKDL